MKIKHPSWKTIENFVVDTAANKAESKELLERIHEERWTDMWATVASVMDSKPKAALLVLTKAEIHDEDPDEGVVFVENTFVVHDGGKEFTFTIHLWNDWNEPEVWLTEGRRVVDDYFTPVKTKTLPKGIVLLGEKAIPMKDWDGF